MKKYFPPLMIASLLYFSAALRGQTTMEFGGLALATAYRSTGVSAGPTVGWVGFQPGPSFGAFLGQNISKRLGGEIRYLYAQNDLKLSSGGTQTTFAGRSHIVNYDLMIYASPRNAKVRPFLAGGGGIKFYQGTGAEQAFQPLSNLALLTRTNEALPTVDFGGGVKIQVGRRTWMRIEVRDYITKVPKVFAAAPGAKISGLMHQFVPAVGISWNF